MKPVSAGCTFTSDGTNIVQDNKFASSVKGYHHFVEYQTGKLGATQLNTQADNLNIIINENLKRMNRDQLALYGHKLNFDLDSVGSYKYNSAFGESNNTVRPTAMTNQKYADVNYGHMNRMVATNASSDSSDPYVTLLGTNNMNESLQPRMILNSATELMFTGIALIPLAEIRDVYKQMPTLAQIYQLASNIQTNLASSNSWEIVYGGGSQSAGTAYSVAGLKFAQPYGSTCPFLVSNCGSASGTGAGQSSNYGLTVYPTAANTEFRIRITAKIGYNNDNAVPCQLLIPSYTMNPEYANVILKNPSHRILYNDHAMTWFNGIRPQSGNI